MFPRALLLPLIVLFSAPTPASAEPVEACAGQLRGKKINISLIDAPIDEAFRILAKVGRANIVLAGDITGTVTVQLTNVPWDRAMCAIAHSKKLRVMWEDGIYTVVK